MNTQATLFKEKWYEKWYLKGHALSFFFLFKKKKQKKT